MKFLMIKKKSTRITTKISYKINKIMYTIDLPHKTALTKISIIK